MAFSFFKKNSETNNPTDDGLKVKQIIKETTDTVSLVFENPNWQYQSGQFLSLSFPIDGKEETRSYSLCSAPNTDQDLAVTVKRVEGGLISNYINDQVKEGDHIKVIAPAGVFTLPESKGNAFLFFGAGSGITPLFSMIKTILHQEADAHLTLVYTNRHEDSIIFKTSLAALEAQHANFKVIHILTRPTAEWQGKTGRLNADDIQAIYNEFPAKDQLHVYSCGPAPMMDLVAETLQKAGVAEQAIHQERFTASTGLTESESEEIVKQLVKIRLDGEEHEVEVNPDQTILEAALDQDIDMPFSCQSGLCTACRGRCTEGKVVMEEDDGLSEDELDGGYVLTCVSHPKSAGVVIEIE
ncbi:ferredoxin--NADP reductase [Persicobacter psychrovividus]|uniref:Phenylacetic acid degradation protein n=1 Tax=Persicobacter psychrovividus TaxID=387638 RepID=A0ABN6L5Y9_9BACT|nr:phenylacetic acid degradation protein [Persicobacter psychrovividus]